jgi:hypothetical protein
MDANFQQAPPVAPRASILARIAPALSYALPALGTAVSALMLINVFQAMRNAESAGIAAVSAGIAEANLPIIVTLYLAVVLGLAGVVVGIIRIFVTTKTATPSAWFFLITGFFGLAPMLLLWEAQSLLLGVIFGHATSGVAEVARQVSLLSLMAICFGVVTILILLVTAFIPLPRFLRAKRSWAPVVVLLGFEIAFIAMTALYHLRTAWLWAEHQKY